jgi:dihydropteroate synthase
MNTFPKIMGIVNVTPDSFSDGGLYYSHKNAVEHAIKLIHDGADIIDIGGESTRPGAESISTEEELSRVIPVIEGIKKEFPEIIISIDTTKYEVAQAAINEGAEIINDISGLKNSAELAKLAAENNITIILMHIQGEPRSMQINPVYENVVEDIFKILKERIEKARHVGLEKIIADVGIGFGKTLEHNIELIKNQSRFKALGVPLMLGISRKSFIGKIFNIEKPAERDVHTALIHALILDSDIDYIRVHNVEYISILKKLYEIFKKK